ncbi:hypothetical protein SXCC_02146 [Gluconacetobacter sp. SXCC-1]|uniref:Uncharacterized protein n=1 Tax=Komagataeibacter rhaeticus TaxID=215221 RepID=A0A181C9M9_9PROT|nr:hypothetical protein [Komagataeibacter rhaeticus]EGG76935.1 hypothetical protein SXCC_02146 [Gluconacetobacter sp. SXCC-1]QIP35091.1 hypothetical protein GWK63_06035 [Komagataeibacter rhaeticus]QOC47646.1 hypothetical protein ICJ78_06105 [Komagataeibacter rhaeticus]WPP23003.1 hypothetical protein SCD25_05835 [Komagataeibacter rhaeticus]SAY48248.1 hypothetical protein KRIGEM_01194 [Komagataeibacter rhaeticus]
MGAPTKPAMTGQHTPHHARPVPATDTQAPGAVATPPAMARAPQPADRAGSGLLGRLLPASPPPRTSLFRK